LKTMKHRFNNFRKIAILALFSWLPLDSAAAELKVEVTSDDRTIRVEAWDAQQSIWVPAAQAYLDGRAGSAYIKVPEDFRESNLRVMASSAAAPSFARKLSHLYPSAPADGNM